MAVPACFLPVLFILGAFFAVATDCSAKAAFPLSVAPGGRYLVDASGAPFLIHGDTAWSLIAQLRREDVDHYLADRRERGFNAILVSLIEHRFATNAPKNAYGEAPFAAPGNFMAPNEAYFAHADWVLARAASEGFLVLLAPSYAGFNGGDEGWYREQQAAGPESLRRYGEYLGRRYREYTNILWVNAGDYNPPDKTLARAIAEGIQAQDLHTLQTAHGSPGYSSLDYWRGESWLRINAVYTYGPVFKAMLEQRSQYGGTPYFLLESTYENEQDSTPRRLRLQAYQALLTGAAGHVFGNNPVWHFDGPGIYAATATWKEALDSEGARSMVPLRALMTEFAWWRMAPGPTLIVAGQGDEEDRAVAALADDGGFALVYLPSRRDVLLELSRLSGPRVMARWYDPVAGSFENIAESPFQPKGRHGFGGERPPNAGGDEDWVLVLESQP